MPPVRRLLNTKTICRPPTDLLDSLRQNAATSDKKDVISYHRDVRLICRDGVVSAHGWLLSTHSSFFKKCFASQGDNYLTTRDVCIPDLSFKDVTTLINLLYVGKIELATSDEAKTIQEMIDFFEIKIKTELEDRGQSTEIAVPLFRVRVPMPRAAKEPQARKKRNLRTDDTDEDDDEDVNMSATPKKKTPRSVVEYAWKMTNKTSSNKVTPPPASTLKRPQVVVQDSPKKAGGPSPVTARKNNTPLTVVSSPVKPQREEPAKEANKPLKEKATTPSEKFIQEAKRCQVCKKVFECPSLASDCLTGHGKLRCYFCFLVCPDTDTLFSHLRVKHSQAGRDNCLLCPYCDPMQLVPFKSVSSHVISVHLGNPKTVQANGHNAATLAAFSQQQSTNPPSKSSTTPSNPSPAQTPPRKKNNSLEPSDTASTLKRDAHQNRGDMTHEERSPGTEENVSPSKEPPETDPPAIITASHYVIGTDGFYRMTNLDFLIRGEEGKCGWRVQKEYYQD